MGSEYTISAYNAFSTFPQSSLLELETELSTSQSIISKWSSKSY